ncbi:MAG TPA: TetR family transcriptional regulator [Pseudonocardia sp.]|nr:TetR family transcriptional regulator [Pseudonocardia sp.]
MSVTRTRADRVEATRSSILAAAERLFAERGFGVSARQIGEAAGQGNTACVGYHFGTKEDLVRAIVRFHIPRIERLRYRILADVCDDSETGDSAEVRDWVSALVVPMTEYLDALGTPSWFARFHAQATSEPVLREIVAEESQGSLPLVAALDGLHRCLPGLPHEVQQERSAMARVLMLHTCAERERALAEDRPTARRSWAQTATGLVDVITALWLAPTTPAGSTPAGSTPAGPTPARAGPDAGP